MNFIIMIFDGIFDGVTLSVDKNVIYKNFDAIEILQSFVHPPLVLLTSTRKTKRHPQPAIPAKWSIERS